jgi:hypothetical protein
MTGKEIMPLDEYNAGKRALRIQHRESDGRRGGREVTPAYAVRLRTAIKWLKQRPELGSE